MILSVSRRTDIPNYYSEWFLNRIREGFLYVRNPMNPHQISEISLSPDMVDCIVFWTKNPAPMLGRLEELRDYPFYFQFTLTGYGRDVEPQLPDKRSELIGTFQKLSRQIGSDRVVWRYDPIFLNERYTVEYHRKAFGEIAASLKGYTHRAVISFLDFYVRTRRNMEGLHVQNPTDEELVQLAGELAQIAQKNGLIIETCAEKLDLQKVGIRHGSCIDKGLIEKITGCKLKAAKDQNQRAECGCVESVEVGTYDTCQNGCRYCYANNSEKSVKNGVGYYDAHSPLLCGVMGPEDKLTRRKMKSLLERQTSLFDDI